MSQLSFTRARSRPNRSSSIWFGTPSNPEVQDHGRGIDEADLERIFDSFFTTRPTHGGTGPGLSVVHGIVGEHGGHIRCESQVGVGTRMTVTLPLI